MSEHEMLAAADAKNEVSVGLTSTRTPIIYGDPIVLTATVTSAAGKPTGEIVFYDKAVRLGNALLNDDGVATLIVRDLPRGKHRLTAAYSGDTAFKDRTSKPLQQRVKRGFLNHVLAWSRKNTFRLIEVAGFAIALVALGIGVQDLQHVTKLVEKATFTYVGAFPEDLSAIQEVMDHTCQQLDIMTDVPSYGILSAVKRPRTFDDYETAVLKTRQSRVSENRRIRQNCVGVNPSQPDREEVGVRMLLFFPSGRERARKGQIPVTFLQDERNKSDLVELIRRNRGNLELGSLDSPEDYVKQLPPNDEGLKKVFYILETLSRQAEDRFFQKGVEVRFADPYTLNLWLRDDNEAAFSLALPFSPEREKTFRTADHDLLSSLRRTFNYEWEHACRYECYYKHQCSKEDHANCPAEQQKRIH